MGAIKDKHIRIAKIVRYIILYIFVPLATCNANCCDSLFDLGQCGSDGDSGVLGNLKLG